VTQFERTNDMELVRKILAHPRLWDHMTDDFCPTREEFTPVNDPLVWYVLATDGPDVLGLFLFSPQNGICWDAHVCILPHAWGARAQQAVRGVIQWVFDTTPCRRIVASIPEYNRLVLRFAERAGFEVFGVNRRSFQKNGRLQDQIMLGISKSEVV
jgi:RimJ/RimL family protein N-acetyltransferase